MNVSNDETTIIRTLCCSDCGAVYNINYKPVSFTKVEVVMNKVQTPEE